MRAQNQLCRIAKQRSASVFPSLVSRQASTDAASAHPQTSANSTSPAQPSLHQRLSGRKPQRIEQLAAKTSTPLLLKSAVQFTENFEVQRKAAGHSGKVYSASENAGQRVRASSSENKSDASSEAGLLGRLRSKRKAAGGTYDAEAMAIARHESEPSERPGSTPFTGPSSRRQGIEGTRSPRQSRYQSRDAEFNPSAEASSPGEPRRSYREDRLAASSSPSSDPSASPRKRTPSKGKGRRPRGRSGEDSEERIRSSPGVPFGNASGMPTPAKIIWPTLQVKELVVSGRKGRYAALLEHFKGHVKLEDLPKEGSGGDEEAIKGRELAKKEVLGDYARWSVSSGSPAMVERSVKGKKAVRLLAAQLVAKNTTVGLAEREKLGATIAKLC